MPRKTSKAEDKLIENAELVEAPQAAFGEVKEKLITPVNFYGPHRKPVAEVSTVFVHGCECLSIRLQSGETVIHIVSDLTADVLFDEPLSV